VRAERNRRIRPISDGAKRCVHATLDRHSAASAGLLATAWRACKPWISSCDAHGMWLRSGGGCLSPGEPPPSGVSVRHHLHIVRSDRGHSPEGRPLAACRCLRVHSASLLTRGLRHVRGRPREHCRVTVTRSQVVEPPMCSVPVHRRLGMGHARSLLVRLAARQLAGCTASARSGCIGSILECDRSSSE